MAEPPPDPLYTFRGGMASVHCILPVITELNELIYVGTNSGHVHVWDLKLKREKIKHEVGSEACLCILHDNELFLTQQKGDSIKFWSENNNGQWQLKKILKHDYCGFCKMVLFKNSLYVANSRSDMIIYDYTNNKEKNQVGEKNLGEIMCFKVIVSIECILICYESGEMILWNIRWSMLSKTKITEDCPMALDFCEQTKEGILGTNNNKILKFVLNEKNQIFLVGEAILMNPGVSSIAIREDGKLCVIGCWDSRIRYYTMKKLKLLAVLTHHTDSVDSIVFVSKGLSFSGNGLVIAGGKDTRVSLWNLYTISQNQFANKTLET